MTAAQKRAAADAAAQADKNPQQAASEQDQGLRPEEASALLTASGGDALNLPGLGLSSNLPPETQALIHRLLLTQLRTAEMAQAQAEAAADKFAADTRTVAQKAIAAQTALQEESALRRRLKKGCAHRQGGFGLEGTFIGKGDPSLLTITLPVPGHGYIQCYRCGGEWRTPDPALQQTDPLRYKKLMRVWKRMTRLLGESANTPLGSPVFSFTKNGTPFAPSLK